MSILSLLRILARRLTALPEATEGATAIEYSLIGGLVALAILIGVGLLGTNLATIYNALAAAFTS